MIRKAIAMAFLSSAIVFAVPVQARWLEAETKHFRLYSDGNEAQLRKFAVMLEDYDQVVRRHTGTSAPASPIKLDIYLVGGVADLRVVRPVSADTAGFYSADWGAIAAFAIRRDGFGMGGDDVLLHEYAHHFMMQYYPVAYPTWYVEGFAEFMMTANITDKVIEVGRYNQNRAYWLVNGGWLPVERVLSGDLRGLNAEQRSMFYAQSWLIVHWMFSQPGRAGALNRYLAAHAKGEDGKTAFEREMGMNYAAFHKALKRYVAGSLKYLRSTRASDRTPVPVAVRQLPASADDLLLPLAAIRQSVSEDRGPAMLARVRKDASRYPGDAFATLVLAAAELDFGDRAAGSAMLDGLIANGAKDAETLTLRGYADLVAARKLEGDARKPLYVAARKWFGRAFRADPNYVPALVAYVETWSLGPMDDNTLNVLLQAQALAPQVESIRFEAAIALMRRKEFAVAQRMIEPLASDPHGGTSAEFARALLAKAKGGVFTEADLHWQGGNTADDGADAGSKPSGEAAGS